MVNTPASKHTTLEGILDRIVFFNEENGFTVARLQVANRRDLVAIVGVLSSPMPGETLRLKGEWVIDVKFGEQFRVQSCLSVLPATLTGIEKYLGSGLVKGIGPIMAKRIVARFGLDTLDVIEDSTEKLQEVEGIGPIRVERIAKAWQDRQSVAGAEGNKGSDGLSSRRGSELHLCRENLQGIR
jgi:exodeoxyribonuclease V alpha subunit